MEASPSKSPAMIMWSSMLMNLVASKSLHMWATMEASPFKSPIVTIWSSVSWIWWITSNSIKNYVFQGGLIDTSRYYSGESAMPGLWFLQNVLVGET